MARATCRCGQLLEVPAEGSERIVCPNCGARVRIRVRQQHGARDGFVRFFCPCGRRLKVTTDNRPSHGKCPTCGRIVPVPDLPTGGSALPPGHPETPTAELSTVDAARLDEWIHRHLGQPAFASSPSSTILQTSKPTERIEAGLRVCPKCGRPVHLSAVVCRECGAHVPKH
jgi:DNA-directed RNA polymerase subunit RPC12/RpoP